MHHIGAGKGVRTPDLNLGKVALYQLSYARIFLVISSKTSIIQSSVDKISW